MPSGMSLKGWEVKKDTDTAEEKAQAFKELEHWELKLRLAKAKNKKGKIKEAEKWIEYWKRIV